MSNIELAERQKWLGASEVAALFGESPYSTRFSLYHEKLGNLPHADLDGDERVQAGNFLEPAIAAFAAEAWGIRLRKVNRYIPHPSVERMGCSLDYEAFGEGSGYIPVEIKNVDSLIFRDGWKAQRDTIVDAPIHILLQAQHQLACTGAPYAYLIALVGGNRLLRMRFDRDPETIALIEGEVAKFWVAVDARQEPRADFLEDAETIGQLYKRVAAAKAIDMTGHNRLPMLIAEYRAASAAAKAADDRKKSAKAEMLTIIGDAEVVTCGADKITAKEIHKAEVVMKATTYRDFRLNPTKKEAA